MREGISEKMTFDLRSKEMMRANQLTRKGRGIANERSTCAKAFGRESMTVLLFFNIVFLKFQSLL